MKVRFACTSCETPGRLDIPAQALWQCPACDHLVQLPGQAESPVVHTCLVCGNEELYKKKDFPHALGMGILTVACIVSFFTYGMYEKWLTWVILIGTALFDGLLYLCVGDAIVCYQCNAHYRRFLPRECHRPYELTIGERYRQARLRQETLRRDLAK